MSGGKAVKKNTQSRHNMPSASCSKMETKLSAWTPLNNPLANTKVFVERRSLLAKWFSRWSHSQRKAVLQDFVLSCSVEQLRFLSLSVSRRLPLEAADFTCLLPRALSLYIFSFLDPRSLCRCAQVSWHWRGTVELDQLWRRKCARIGWSLSVTPTAFEQGAWKRHYIQRVLELRPKGGTVPPYRRHQEAPEVALSSEDPPGSTTQPPPGGACGTGSRRKERQLGAPPPWRDSDKQPKDTVRFNYLDNLDPLTEALRGLSTSRRTSACRDRDSQPHNNKARTLTEAHYKLRKAKSLMFLSSNCRPPPPPPPPPPPFPPPLPLQPAARDHTRPVAQEVPGGPLRAAPWDAGMRPRPVRTPVPRLSVEALRASRRTHRSMPSTPLFQAQPWTASATQAQGNHNTTMWTGTELQHAA